MKKTVRAPAMVLIATTAVAAAIAMTTASEQISPPLSQPPRFIIDSHQHYRDEPGYIGTLVRIYRPRHAMACVLTPVKALEVVRAAAKAHPDVVIPYGYVPFAIRQDWRTGTLSNPYVEFDTVPFPYVYDPSNIRFILPANLSGIALDYDLPYTYQFNVAVQQQLRSGLSATIAYVAARGRNLPFTTNLNYPSRGPGSVNSRRPILPGTLGNIQILDSFLTNQYDGLQMTLDKRLSQSFMANASYTFGKSLEDARLQDDIGQAVQNFNDILADRGRTDNDRRHQFKASLIWTSDYFRGGNRLLHTLLDGWTVSGIVKLRSGRPLTITAGRDANGDGTNNDRADLVSGADPTLDSNRGREEQITQWFNTDAFAEPAALTDGNSPRTFIDGPGSKIIDIGIYRDFPVGGGRKLQLRMEATNAFNFVNLDNPSTNIRSSDFGEIDEAGPMRRIQLGARFSF